METADPLKPAGILACLPRTGFSKRTVRGKLARIKLGPANRLRRIAGVFHAHGAFIGEVMESAVESIYSV